MQQTIIASKIFECSPAVHTFFATTLFGRQYLNPTLYDKDTGEDSISLNEWQTLVLTDSEARGKNYVNLVGYDNENGDFYVPIFTILQFIFYMGWLHVAKATFNISRANHKLRFSTDQHYIDIERFSEHPQSFWG